MEGCEGCWCGLVCISRSLILFSCDRTKAERIRALESIKAGRRLAESRFGVLQVASKGQKSVASIFGSR